MKPSVPLDASRTRDQILTLLLRSDTSLSVNALARALAISRNAAHQHITALEREGLVEKDVAIRTKGRPSQSYRLSDAGGARFPRQYPLLARQLLEQLTRRLEPAELDGAMDAIGRDLASGLAGQVERGSPRAIDQIAGLMGRVGYDAHAEGAEEAREIVAHNCVFHDVALADPRVCRVDLALLGALSGREVEHRCCMARGERSCRFAFGPAVP